MIYIGLLIFSLTLRAQPDPIPSVREICERALTIDEKVGLLLDAKKRLEDHPAVARRFLDNGYTHLLNQAVSPFLFDLRDFIHARPTDLLRQDIHEWLRRDDVPALAGEPRSWTLAMGMDRAFDGKVHWFPSPQGYFSPYTNFNRDVIVRYARAAALVQTHAEKQLRRQNVIAQFVEAHDLLDRASFTERNVSQLVKLGTESVLQAVSLLTAEPIAGLSAEEILTRVTAPRGRCISLVEQLALLLPPRLLGRTGSSVYVSGAMASEGDHLVLSQKLRSVLNAYRDSITQFASYEHGFGCPVAHPLRGHEVSGLQAYMEAIRHVYLLDTDP